MIWPWGWVLPERPWSLQKPGRCAGAVKLCMTYDSKGGEHQLSPQGHWWRSIQPLLGEERGGMSILHNRFSQTLLLLLLLLGYLGLIILGGWRRGSSLATECLSKYRMSFYVWCGQTLLWALQASDQRRRPHCCGLVQITIESLLLANCSLFSDGNIMQLNGAKMYETSGTQFWQGDSSDIQVTCLLSLI